MEFWGIDTAAITDVALRQELEAEEWWQGTNPRGIIGLKTRAAILAEHPSADFVSNWDEKSQFARLLDDVCETASPALAEALHRLEPGIIIGTAA